MAMIAAEPKACVWLTGEQLLSLTAALDTLLVDHGEHLSEKATVQLTELREAIRCHL
jgi:hypothetical protein